MSALQNLFDAPVAHVEDHAGHRGGLRAVRSHQDRRPCSPATRDSSERITFRCIEIPWAHRQQPWPWTSALNGGPCISPPESWCG
jgi:hypothetical protein